MPARPADDSLDLLAYFHFAVGALSGMLALVPGLFLFVNYSLTDAAVEPGVRAQATSALRFGPVAFALCALAAGLLVCALLVAEGFLLKARRRWAFCRAASLVGCLFVPLGTILGAATLGLLNKPEVRAEFR